MGVYKRLAFCQKLPQKSQFLVSKLGGGRLLENERLLEILRYMYPDVCENHVAACTNIQH